MVKVEEDDVQACQTEWDRPIVVDVDASDVESAKKGTTGEQPVPIIPTASPMVHHDSHIIKNIKLGTVPSKKWTGVDESITQICANLSNQIYDARASSYFKLETDDGSVNAEVIIFDDHGELKPAIPSFAVAATEDTLIMGWAGTQEVMDLVTDAAMAPVVATELGKAATGIRIHAMFSALVGSDLTKNEDAIISYIKKHRITNIVFTGHSLGGALASAAHLFVQAQVGKYNDSSAWDTLAHTPTLHSVTFAAPMSALDRDEVGVDNTHADKLIDDVGKNTSNFIFASDVVPRAYGHVQFMYAATEAVAPEAIREANPLWFGLGTGRASEAVLNFIREGLSPLIPVAVKFRHTGRLLYYPNAEATEPLVLVDTGPAGNNPSKDKTHLNHYTYGSYGIRRRQHVDTILSTHSHFPTALASYISVEKVDSK